MTTEKLIKDHDWADPDYRNQFISDWLASDQGAFPPFAAIVEEFPKIKWLVTELSHLKTNPVCPLCNNDFVGCKWIVAEENAVYYHIPCYIEEHRKQPST